MTDYRGTHIWVSCLVATARTVVTTLNDHLRVAEHRELLPNFEFNHTRENMVIRARAEGTTIAPAPVGHRFDRYVSVDVGSDILPMFFLSVNTCLNQLILRAPDFNEHWMNTLNRWRVPNDHSHVEQPNS